MKKPTRSVEKGTRSSGKKTRDMKRLIRYLENKRILRELPFNYLRDGQFRSMCDTSYVLRAELQGLKVKHRKFNELKSCMWEKIGKAESEIKRLQIENTDLRKKLRKQSERNNDDIYLKKIRKLEEDAHGDKVILSWS